MVLSAVKKLLIAFAIMILAAGHTVAQDVPDYDGPINDLAGVLSQSDIETLKAQVMAYRNRTGHEIGVLLVETLDGRSIEDYAYDVFQAWGIGQKDKDNGVLFVVALKERRARIEVGYGLEADLTDVESGRIVSRDSQMAEQFRKGEFAAGVRAVIGGIIQAISSDYRPVKVSRRARDKSGSGWVVFFPFLFILASLLRFVWRGPGSSGRRFGGPFIGGMGGRPWGSSGGSFRGGGGGFSFGGGSSGGGGASGGW